jgi:hypothetical protein
MPTTTVTGPDGKDYEVTHPEGASDAEILKYAQENIQVSPEGVKEAADILGMSPKTPKVQTPYQSAVGTAMREIGKTGGPAAQTISEFVLPQNEAELGMALGTLGMHALSTKLGLTPVKSAAARIAGGAVGGELGGQVSGEPTGKGAATGGLGAATGETIVPAAGWVIRSLPGMKQYINAKRSGEIGKVIESRVPALAGARDPHALDQMARNFELGKGALFDYYAGLKNRFEQALGGQRLRIPELIAPEDLAKARAIRQQIASNQGQFTPQNIAAMQARADQLESVPISSVWDELKGLGHTGYGGAKADPNTRTIVGQPSRIEYGDLINKTKSELNRIDPSGALSAQFEADRKTAAAGFTFLKMLQERHAFNRYPKDVQLNISFLQDYVNRNQSEIEKKIGPDAFGRLREILWPGGGKMGTRDIPATTAGGAVDVPMETARGFGGSPRLITAPLRSLLPSLGAQYAGRAPFTPPQGLRALADYLLQRGLAPFSRYIRKSEE